MKLDHDLQTIIVYVATKIDRVISRQIDLGPIDEDLIDAYGICFQLMQEGGFDLEALLEEARPKPKTSMSKMDIAAVYTDPFDPTDDTAEKLIGQAKPQ